MLDRNVVTSNYTQYVLISIDKNTAQSKETDDIWQTKASTNVLICSASNYSIKHINSGMTKDCKHKLIYECMIKVW